MHIYGWRARAPGPRATLFAIGLVKLKLPRLELNFATFFSSLDLPLRIPLLMIMIDLPDPLYRSVYVRAMRMPLRSVFFLSTPPPRPYYIAVLKNLFRIRMQIAN
jgi:hypothetical protein